MPIAGIGREQGNVGGIRLLRVRRGQTNAPRNPAGERPAFWTLHPGRRYRAGRRHHRSGRCALPARQAPSPCARRRVYAAVRGHRDRCELRAPAARYQCGRAAPPGLAHQDHDALSAVRADGGRQVPARTRGSRFRSTPRSRHRRSLGCGRGRPSRSKTRSARWSPSRRTTSRRSSRKRSAATKKPSRA